MRDEAFFQPGKSPISRQSSGLPAAWDKASVPTVVTDTLNNVQPGQAIPRVVILTALPEEFLAAQGTSGECLRRSTPR